MNSDKSNSVSVKYDNLQNGDCGKKETVYTFDLESTGTEVKMMDQNGNGKSLTRRKTHLEKKLFFLVVVLLFCLVVVIGVLFGQIHRGHKEFGVAQSAEKSHSHRAFVVEQDTANSQLQRDSGGKNIVGGSNSHADCTFTHGNDNDNVCLTPTCVTTAAGMMSRMDQSVEPCDDFYRYACGGWTENNVIPEDQPSHGVFYELMEALSIECKALLEEEKRPDEPEAITKTKHFYKSCLNEEVIDERGAEPLQNLLTSIGGWPVVNDFVFDESTWSIEETEAKLKRIANGNSLFNQNIYPDPKDSGNFIITIDQPILGLGLGTKDMYLQNTTHKNVEAYLEFMIDIATDLRGDGDRETVAAEMQQVLDFEIQIAEVVLTLQERRASIGNYHKISIEELTALTPSFSWLRYFREMFGPDIEIDGTEKVICNAVRFLEGFQRVIESTPKRTLANYVMWHLVFHTVPMLGKKQREYVLKFNAVKYGEMTEEARWRLCYKTTNDNMHPSMGHMFINRHFDESSKTTAEEMIDDLKENAIKVIQRAVWMDNSTKETAVRKVQSIKEQIGYDELTKNISAINEKYSSIQIDEDRFFENSLAIWSLAFQDMVNDFRQSVTNKPWESSVVQVNAFYHFTRNYIRFPAGILQPPFFVALGPKSVNYGGIGVIIGHELSHAFDDKGRMFDENGDLYSWWSPESKAAFDEKTQCLVDQYSGYTVDQVGVNVNGQLTLGENIADNGGLNSAYEAYQTYLKRQDKPEKLLPGLSLNHNQLFFVNFAQFWCALFKDDFLKLSLKGDVHPPGPVRVLGPLSNSHYFSEAFNCPVGSPYNPERKCKVW